MACLKSRAAKNAKLSGTMDLEPIFFRRFGKLNLFSEGSIFLFLTLQTRTACQENYVNLFICRKLHYLRDHHKFSGTMVPRSCIFCSLAQNPLKNLGDVASESNRVIILWNGSVPTFMYRAYKNKQEILRNFLQVERTSPQLKHSFAQLFLTVFKQTSWYSINSLSRRNFKLNTCFLII